MSLDALLEAVKRGDAAAVDDHLRGDPGLLNARDPGGNSAVLLAAYSGQARILKDLLARGPVLTAFEAAATGETRRLRECLEADAASAAAFSADGYTALGLASFFGHLQAVNLLLGRGAPVNVASRNDMNVMPLHSAVAGRHLAVAKVLLEHGADPNAVSHAGWTPIHGAADHGDMALLRVLLAHGAQPDPRNDDGLTPADLAQSKAHVEAVELLTRRAG
jgi:ankyrin repeat protein